MIKHGSKCLFSRAGIVFTAVIFLAVWGCTSRREDKGKIQISIACIYSPTDTGCQIIDKSVDKFMMKYPEIKVKKIWFTKDYQSKLLTMITGGMTPDIFRISPGWAPTYISRGILMPLDDFVRNSTVLKFEDFFPQVLYKYRFDGEIIGKGPIYGFPTDWCPDSVLFFNKDMFDKEGIPYPTKSLSWEEFRDIAKKLTHREKGKKQFGCMLWYLPNLVYQNGGMVFSPDGKQCLLDTPEAIGAFQFLVELSVKDKVMPSYAEAREAGLLQLFQTGKLGMFLSGRFYVPIVQGVVKNFRWGVAPGLHQKRRVNVARGPYGWVISKTTKHPEETWLLMEWLVAGECEEDLAKAGYGIPVIKRMAYSELFLTNPDHPEGVNKLFLDEVEYTIPSPLTPYCPTNRWQEIIKEELELAYLGKQTAEKSAKNACKRIDDLIMEGIKIK